MSVLDPMLYLYYTENMNDVTSVFVDKVTVILVVDEDTVTQANKEAADKVSEWFKGRRIQIKETKLTYINFTIRLYVWNKY